MKARVLIILASALVLLGSLPAQQTDNMVTVKSFPGVTVGGKLSAAMQSCNPNTAVPCILVLDPSLAAWPVGTMPTLCAQCSLADYRLGAYGGNSSGRFKNLASIGPRYDITQFGALGNGASDDTAAIQAASDICSSAGGGVVEFPGAHSYVISASINLYHGCSLEGIPTATSGSTTPVKILWNGPAVGVTANIAQTAIASNVATITAANSYTAGEWVLIQNESAGFCLNNTVAQVLSAGLSNSHFEVNAGHACADLAGTADAGLVTSINVAFYTDNVSRYQQSIEGIQLTNITTSLPKARQFGVGIYLGSRVDSGTSLHNDWIDSALYFDYYFSSGGINFYADNFRSDGNAGIAMFYWRAGSGDSLSLSDASLSASVGQSGAYIMLDTSACMLNSVRMTTRNIRFEVDTPFYPGFGGITLLDCPSYFSTQFWLDSEGSYQVDSALSAAGYNQPSIVMNPANEQVLNLTAMNSLFGIGSGPNTTTPFVGLPTLNRYNSGAYNGVAPFLSYAPPVGGTINGNQAPMQMFGDLNLTQLYQYKTQASALLYTDTAFAALPNGTTLNVGQIIAPPVYWAATTSQHRYALDVVNQAGTTGTPNNGQTSCTSPSSGTLNCGAPQVIVSATSCTGSTLTFTVPSGGAAFANGYQFFVSGTAEGFLNTGPFTVLSSSGTSVSTSYYCNGFAGNASDAGTLTLSSVQDLSAGQWINVAGIATARQIHSINAGNPANVVIVVSGSTTVSATAGALTYSAPLLGNEMQVPTKLAAAPTTGVWSPGDIVENLAPAAGGGWGWICTAGGTPGTWVPLSVGPLAAITASIGGSALTVGCTNQTAQTVTGATTAMQCQMSGAGGTQPANVIPQCFVSAANTVTPQLCTAVAVTPTAQTYNVRVQ